MRFLKLRIAWSVVCGVVCLLLIALWVRSRYAYDGIIGPLPGSGFTVMSRSGALGVALYLKEWTVRWTAYTLPPQEVRLPYHTAIGFVEYMEDSEAYRLRLPYWFLVLISAALAATPWLRWRFSLRTLLIATTLVAMVLGAIVYATR